MVQRAITQTRWRPPSCFREYFWDGTVYHGKNKLIFNDDEVSFVLEQHT
jgi:hypothetical protein